MGYRLITAPADYPVTADEAKLHCRVDGTADETLIATYIAAATAYAELHTGRSIVSQTWELVEDGFSDPILIEKGPVQSITSVKYIDTNGDLQTLAADQYELDNVADPAAMVKPADVSYPATADGVNNVIVRFVAGYATVPEPIRAAIMVLVASWYDNRSTGEVPDAVHSLLANYRSF